MDDNLVFFLIFIIIYFSRCREPVSYERRSARYDRRDAKSSYGWAAGFFAQATRSQQRSSGHSPSTLIQHRIVRGGRCHSTRWELLWNVDAVSGSNHIHCSLMQVVGKRFKQIASLKSESGEFNFIPKYFSAVVWSFKCCLAQLKNEEIPRNIAQHIFKGTPSNSGATQTRKKRKIK